MRSIPDRGHDVRTNWAMMMIMIGHGVTGHAFCCYMCY